MFGIVLASGAEAAVHEFSPGDDWCGAFATAQPGDQIVLRRGIYRQPCTIRAQGAPGRPIVLRSATASRGNRAVLAYGGSSANVIDVRASAHLVIQDLDITARSKQVEGIKIYDARDVTIQRNRLHRLAGVGVSANGADSQGLVIRDNEFKSLSATAIYLGCHDGAKCRARDARIERNLIDGAMPRDDRIGYGIQVKLNSDAVIRDNSVYNTKGPGIMVYGNEAADGPASLIEGNYVQRSAWDGGIVVGGGPVVVRNNVVIDCALTGIVAQDYHQRGLQHEVKIVHNTLMNNLRGGVSVEGWEHGKGNVIANNLIVGTPDQLPIKPPRVNGTVTGNDTCPSATECLLIADQSPYDLRVQPKHPLRGSREMGDEDWWPADDFLGLARETPTTPGAFVGRYPPEHDMFRLGDAQPRPARVTP